eukprot:g5930.t1
MVDVAVTILQVVVEIRDVTDGIQENDEQARRLSERVKGIQPAVLAVKNGRKRLSSESLRQVLETVENIRNFLDEYARMTKLTRVWKRKSNAAKFKEFRTDLSDGRQALQLDVVVDTWAKEDASDRLEDIAHLKYAIKREQRNSSIENRAEFTRAVKELEKDERSELKALSAWVEIDFDKELDLDGSLRLGSGGFGELCDFGLSKIKAESSSRSARGSVGTSQWMSPEEMDGNAATIRTDVYSFGVVCFEVATRMEPLRVPSAPGAATDRAFLQNATAMATPTKEPIAAAAPAPAPPTQDAGTDRSFVQKAIDTVAPLLLAGFDRTQATTAPSPPSPVRDATTDRAALLTLYLVTHGPWKESNFFGLVKKGGWKNRKGWATSRPTSGWWGIGTSSVGRITRLSLSRNNLRGPIPKEIGALTAVEHLDVSYNELSGPLPKEIGALTALKNLSLFHNQLSGPIPKEIGALTALQRLSLSYNELTGPIPKELQGLKSLKYMECHSNGLSERNKAEIKRMLRSVSYNVHL